MKALFFFFLSLFFLQECEAQRAVVANVKENVAYVGISNPLEVLVEGYKCNQINVSTNNGTIEMSEYYSSFRTSNDCYFVFIPNSIGRAKIFIRNKKGVKEFQDSFEFRAKQIPDPTFEIAPNKERVYHRKRQYPGIVYSLNSFQYDVRFISQQYSVSISRGKEIIFKYEKVKGNLFEEIKEGLQMVRDGDKILFYDLVVRGPDNKDREISPVEFTVAE